MTENGKVTIVPDEHGNVIRVSKNNPEYGHIRLTQEKLGISTTNWVRNQSKSTLIHGTVEDLQATGIADKKELPGQIITREQLTPFSNENPDRDLKIAGETGIICVGINTDTGEVDVPIYRKTFYSMDLSENDILVPHTNSNEIREANGSDSKKVTISKEKLEEMTQEVEEEEKPKTTRRNKKDKTEEIEEIEETSPEEVEVEENSFEL